MKKIILFEDLDIINFFTSVILVFFYKKIYFRSASYAYKSTFFKKNINKIYFQIGLDELNGSLSTKSFILKKYLIKKHIFQNFHLDFFKRFSDVNNIKDKNIKKIIYIYENCIFSSKLLSIETSSYILCKNFFLNNCIVFYYPSEKNTFLLLSEIKNPNFKIIKSTIYMGLFFTFILKLFKVFKIIINFKSSKINKNTYANKNIYNHYPKIGFFPHEGLKYGNFFKKNFIFNKNIKSPLYKNNIETITFGKFDKLTKKFLNFYKLKFFEINGTNYKPKVGEFFCFIKFVIKNYKLIKKNKILIFLTIFEIFFSIKKYEKFLKEKKYKYIFFYNDFLFPPTLILAADINEVKTISFQDRLLSYCYYHRCVFDLYLIAGKKFKKIFNSTYLIKNYKIVGLIRPNLIKKNTQKSIFFEKFKSKSIIACLLLGYRSKYNNNIYGEDGSSFNSIINFCNDIKKISKIYSDKLFVIKFKMYNPNLHDHIIKIISSSNNIILITDDKIESTQLIAYSDLIIGKYSTIMDESLVSGKNILIYDTENFVSTFGFYKKNKFLLASNYESLLFKTKSLLEKKNEFYEFYKIEKKNYISDYLTNNSIVGSPFTLTDAIEEYIKDSNENKPI